MKSDSGTYTLQKHFSLTFLSFRRGKYHTINVPLKRGLSSDNFVMMAEKIIPRVLEKCRPGVIVLQAGCDGLAKDPLGGWVRV